MQKGNVFGGTLRFKHIKAENRYNFIDYIIGGCHLRLSILIDFTKSNLDPTDSHSLHDLTGGKMLKYIF